MSETKIVEKTIIYHVDFAKHRADRVADALHREYGTRCNDRPTHWYQLDRVEVLNPAAYVSTKQHGLEAVREANRQALKSDVNENSLEYKIENLPE